MKKVEIKGIVPPILTPMHEDESVNLQELRNQVNRLIDAGVHGIFPFGLIRSRSCRRALFCLCFPFISRSRISVRVVFIHKFQKALLIIEAVLVKSEKFVSVTACLIFFYSSAADLGSEFLVFFIGSFQL